MDYFTLLSRLFCSSPMKVLIIEDEGLIAMDLALMLRSFGAKEVATAASAEEGLQSLRQHKPDIIFVDIKLKGVMDGVELAEIIQSNDPLPLVYITAYNDESTLERARQVPHLGIINKPFVPADVKRLISRLSS